MAGLWTLEAAETRICAAWFELGEKVATRLGRSRRSGKGWPEDPNSAEILSWSAVGNPCSHRNHALPATRI